MKRKKTQRSTPEEALRQAAESRLGLDFDYKQIRDRLDVAEIARRADRPGKVSPRAAFPPAERPPVSMPLRRPAVAVVTAALLLCATVGAGGMAVAHLANRPISPPLVTGQTEEGTTAPFSATYLPDQEPTLRRDDTLTWGDATYVRTDVTLPADAVEHRLGEVGATETALQGNQAERVQYHEITATKLAEGTVFYGIEGEDSGLCIAVQTEEGYVLYMVPDGDGYETE